MSVCVSVLAQPIDEVCLGDKRNDDYHTDAMPSLGADRQTHCPPPNVQCCPPYRLKIKSQQNIAKTTKSCKTHSFVQRFIHFYIFFLQLFIAFVQLLYFFQCCPPYRLKIIANYSKNNEKLQNTQLFYSVLYIFIAFLQLFIAFVYLFIHFSSVVRLIG